jgi:hypothetical protein
MDNREQLRKLLADSGLTTTKAATMLGKHPVTVQKWSAGIEPTPQWAVELLGYKVKEQNNVEN